MHCYAPALASIEGYCSATSVQKEDFEIKKVKKEDMGKVIWDFDALKHLFDTNPIIQDAIKKQEVLTLNWWAAEPLDWTKECDIYTDWVDKTYPNLKYQLFISTNGIPFRYKHVVEWIYKKHQSHGLKLQLSHDGLGQYIRTRGYDPLYDEVAGPVCIQLVKDDILDMFNLTLNKFNCSPIGNKAFMDKWRFDNHLENYPLLIKLNHNNDAEYTGDFRLRGEELNRYMHEMRQLWIESLMADREKDPLWQPYAGYFENQLSRSNPFYGFGGCAMFSRGDKDWTWCCNTKGEYVFCQLCNDPKDNPNPKVEQGPECADCEFQWYDDCNGCPDMIFSEHCEYKKEYMRSCLEMKMIKNIINNFKKERAELYNELNKLKGNSNCNGKSCNCK